MLKSPARALRSFGNTLGLAWWAKVETQDPKVTYWFGPFLTRKSLKTNLASFMEDLSIEGSSSMNHSLVRGRRSEPLTI